MRTTSIIHYVYRVAALAFVFFSLQEVRNFGRGYRALGSTIIVINNVHLIKYWVHSLGGLKAISRCVDRMAINLSLIHI